MTSGHLRFSTFRSPPKVPMLQKPIRDHAGHRKGIWPPIFGLEIGEDHIEALVRFSEAVSD